MRKPDNELSPRQLAFRRKMKEEHPEAFAALSEIIKEDRENGILYDWELNAGWKPISESRPPNNSRCEVIYSDGTRGISDFINFRDVTIHSDDTGKTIIGYRPLMARIDDVKP